MSRLVEAAAATRDRLRVALGDRSYDIVVSSGLLRDAAAEIGPVLKRKRCFVVTDAMVAPRHLPALTASLEGAGIAVSSIVLPAGEQTKSFGELEQLCDRLLAAGIERGSTLVALGGGVIGDLTGFAAGIILRGIDFVQIPTTLLAQVDSSVGGKTGINTARGKNLVGCFHQPRLVLADIDALATLPRRQLLAGYAEVVKYGLLGDAPLFAWLEKNGAALLAGDPDLRREAVARSCAAKAAIVADDERETGRRALLNLGHTFGHALEAECGYSDQLLHGEAVAIGMAMAFELSAELGLCPRADAARAIRHMAAVGLPTSLAAIGRPSWNVERLIEHMRHDKKVAAGRIAFVLVRGIGEAFVATDVALDDVRRLLGAAAAA